MILTKTQFPNKMETSTLTEIKNKVLGGVEITPAEAYSLLDADFDALCEAAAEITEALCPRDFDSCSIANARSGRCSENCKWCAQSAHWDTGCEVYPLIDEEECMNIARYNAGKGIKRFSLVASGKAMQGRSLDAICSMLSRVGKETGMLTCASLGLLNADDLAKVRACGALRYHCNLETAPSYFPTLCTTHTYADKLATIEAARTAGLDICSGGIIGMGESARQRVEFALALRDIRPVSIPINILIPIPGTPLADSAPLSEKDILTTIAIFRFIHPATQLRFAGGRQKLSTDGQLKAMRTGINGSIVGDMLTTLGSTIDSDKELVADAGYKW